MGALLIAYLGSFGQSSIEQLDDHGKTGGLGTYASYMLHFKVVRPDYDLNRVYISFNDEDTVLQANANGVYRLRLKAKRGESVTLNIGNAAYGKWKDNEAWVQVQSTYVPDAPTRPMNVSFPYKAPTSMVIAKWAAMRWTDRNGMLTDDLGLEIDLNEKVICKRYIAPDYAFAFTYVVESCKEGMVIQYGVDFTKYPTELNWAKQITMDLKSQLESDLTGVKMIGSDPVLYRFEYQDITIQMYLLDNHESHQEGEYSYNAQLMIRWQKTYH